MTKINQLEEKITGLFKSLLNGKTNTEVKLGKIKGFLFRRTGRVSIKNIVIKSSFDGEQNIDINLEEK